MRCLKFIVIVMGFVFITGCSGVPTLSGYTPIGQGIVTEYGLTIKAEDGSFTLSKGRFEPPFTSSIATNYTPDLAVVHSKSEVLYKYSEAMALGAKKVRVVHPASPEPLYGIILFNPKAGQAKGPEARSYALRIPSYYVTNALGGNMSVVFESSPLRSSDYRAYTWILWLSDVPL